MSLLWQSIRTINLRRLRKTKKIFGNGCPRPSSNWDPPCWSVVPWRCYGSVEWNVFESSEVFFESRCDRMTTQNQACLCEFWQAWITPLESRGTVLRLNAPSVVLKITQMRFSENIVLREPSHSYFYSDITTCMVKSKCLRGPKSWSESKSETPWNRHLRRSACADKSKRVWDNRYYIHFSCVCTDLAA
jgi:hypothetical protein